MNVQSISYKNAVVIILIGLVILLTGLSGFLYGLLSVQNIGTTTLTQTETQTFTMTSGQTFTKTQTQTETETQTAIQTATKTTTQTSIQTTTMTQTVTPPIERLEIISLYENSTWMVTLDVKNVGTADATISNIFVNGQPLDSNRANPALPFLLKVDNTVQIKLDFTMIPLTLGETYDFRVHTGSGSDYAKSIIIT
jgi:hypothetical protein